MKTATIILCLVFAGCQHLTPAEKAEREWWKADLKAHRDAWEKIERGEIP